MPPVPVPAPVSRGSPRPSALDMHMGTGTNAEADVGAAKSEPEPKTDSKLEPVCVRVCVCECVSVPACESKLKKRDGLNKWVRRGVSSSQGISPTAALTRATMRAITPREGDGTTVGVPVLASVPQPSGPLSGIAENGLTAAAVADTGAPVGLHACACAGRDASKA